jgi:hypothetical protein
MASGKAGSLLIDIAANTAQLKKDMTEAQAQVAGLAKTVEGAATVVKAAFAAMVAREVINFVVELGRAVGDLADKAKQVGLSTRDFQAFTIAMQQAGASASETQQVLSAGARFLGNALQGNKENITLLNQLKVTILDGSGAARPYATDLQNLAQAFLKISDPLKQAAIAQQVFGREAREVIPALEQLARGVDDAAERAGRGIIPDDVIRRFKDLDDEARAIARTLASDLAVAIDSIAGGSANNAGKALDKIKDSFNDLGLAIRTFGSSDAGAALGAVWGTFLANINLAIKATTFLIELITKIPSLLDKALTAIQAGSLAAQEFAKSMPSTDPGVSATGPPGRDLVGGGMSQAERDALKERQDAQVKSAKETADRIAQINQEFSNRERDRQNRAVNAMLPAPGPDYPLVPPGGSNPPPKSTGAAKPDYFNNTLKGLQDQAKAVTDATGQLTASTGLASKEAERLAKLQIDIAKNTADAVKAAHATSPEQKEALKAAVTDLETAKFKFEDLKTTIAVADQVQATFGDGSKALADRLEYLQKALDLGKISQDDYRKAVTAATEAQAIQAEQSKGLQGGFEGIAAGWNKAALAASGAGAEMKIGEQAFTQTFSTMSGAISEFVTTGQVDFGKLAASFATMLANMAIQWAAAAFLKNLLGGGATADSIMGLVPVSASATSGGMRATGGPVFPNRAYTVGENGPERFIPAMPGNIAANSNSTGDVTVNVAMGGQQGGSDPTKTVEFARRVKAAVVDTISGEKRPGGILYTRQSA